jgi:hypothetical protein
MAKVESKVRVNNTPANREAKLVRHMKKHPNDVQSFTGFNAVSVRKKPVSKGNFPRAKMMTNIDASGFGKRDANVIVW